MVPSVNAPFNMNFMLPVPDASLEANEICSEISVAGIIFQLQLHCSFQPNEHLQVFIYFWNSLSINFDKLRIK